METTPMTMVVALLIGVSMLANMLPLINKNQQNMEKIKEKTKNSIVTINNL